MEGLPDGAAASVPPYDRQHHPDLSWTAPPHLPPPLNAACTDTYCLEGNNTYSQHLWLDGAWSMQSTTTASLSVPIDPALVPAGGWALPVFGPMAIHGVMSQPGINCPYGWGSPMLLASMPPDNNPRVVGSQDPGSILPISSGAPLKPTVGTTQTKKQTLYIQQNVDGTFQCPGCTERFTDRRNMKRHYIKHTGERPYTCTVCLNKFTRSDILKRHSKCHLNKTRWVWRAW